MKNYWKDQSKLKYEYSDFFKKSQNIYLASCIEKLVKNMHNPKLLEAGCGWGYYVKRFSEFGKITGVDNEPGMLSTAKKLVGKNKNISLMKGDIRHLVFKDNSFDIVCSFGVIEHFDETLAALKEMRRVLTPHGYLVVSVPSAYDINNRLFRYIAIKRGKIQDYMQKHYTENKFKEILDSAGLKVESFGGYGYGLFYPQKIKPLEFILNPIRDFSVKSYEKMQKNKSKMLPFCSHMLLAICRPKEND